MEAIWFPAAGEGRGGAGPQRGKAGACCREEAVLVTQGASPGGGAGLCLGSRPTAQQLECAGRLLVLISIIDILVSMVSRQRAPRSWAC